MRYDSEKDYVVISRADGSAVLVPPTGSLMLPCVYDEGEDFTVKQAKKVVGEGGRVYAVRHGSALVIPDGLHLV